MSPLRSSLARQIHHPVTLEWPLYPHQRQRGSQRRSVFPSSPPSSSLSSDPPTPPHPPSKHSRADQRPPTQAAKAAAKGESVSSKSSRAGSKTTTAATSAATSDDEGVTKSMKQLAMETDRSGSGVLASDPQSRDIHIESYSLSFHGRLLIENAEFSLNYGQRYVHCRLLAFVLLLTLFSLSVTVFSVRTVAER